MAAVTGPFGTPQLLNRPTTPENAATFTIQPEVLVDHVWLCIVGIHGQSGNIVIPPSGMVELFEFSGLAGEGHSYLFGKRITTADKTAGSFTFVVATNATPPVQALDNVAGINLGGYGLVDDDITDAVSLLFPHSQAFIAAYTVPSIDATKVGDVLLSFMVSDGNNFISGVPAGMTAIGDDLGFHMGVKAARQSPMGLGASGAKTWNVGSRSGHAFSVLLKATNAQPQVSIAPPGPVHLVVGESQPFTATATDSDGSIVSYNWTKDSGPTNPTISAPAAASTSIGPFSSAGTYVHRVSVVDDTGESNFATVTTIVSASPVSTRARQIDMRPTVGGSTPLGRGTFIVR